jgi:hypothetical protein
MNSPPITKLRPGGARPPLAIRMARRSPQYQCVLIVACIYAGTIQLRASVPALASMTCSPFVFSTHSRPRTPPLSHSPLSHSHLSPPSLSHPPLSLTPFALTPQSLSRPTSRLPGTLSLGKLPLVAQSPTSRFPYGSSADKPWPVLPPLEFRVWG